MALCDEVFPEMSRVLKDPTLPTALAIREQFPTAHAVATASLSSLIALRAKSRPRLDQLVQLQQLAGESIGTTDVVRLQGLMLEQSQLIKELKLLQEHMHQLETEIGSMVGHCREGQILLSMGIGVIQSATLIATIGNILNFEKAADLKSYLGWAPKTDQSGTCARSGEVGPFWSKNNQTDDVSYRRQPDQSRHRVGQAPRTTHSEKVHRR